MKRLAILALFLFSCDPTYLDNGLLERDGVTLHVEGSLGVSGEYAEEVATWWNEQCGVELFYTPTPTPDATIEFGYVPDPDEEGNLGIADIEYSLYDGLITFCAVTISSDISYHEETTLEVAKHEAGHCLGLADDPGSLDLNSIMASPLLYRGQVTPSDCELVAERLSD